MIYAKFMRGVRNYIFALSCSMSMALSVQAQSTQLSAVSLLPLASVVVVSGSAVQLSESASVVTSLLAVAGSVFVIKAVEASAKGTVYVLERISDGLRISVELASIAANQASNLIGTAVTVSTTASGIVLIASGEVLAFIPNELGQALLHNERVSQ
jgi:hypothetical protein